MVNAETDLYQPFDGVLMLRLDITTPQGDTTYYVTPFVTDGRRLYVFDEPGDRSEALEAMLLGNPVVITSKATAELRLADTGRRPTTAEEVWARDACSARFFYDQALQDTAQLGSVVVFGPVEPAGAV